MYNDISLKSKRQSLRKNQTDVEKKLWHQLRNKQLGVKFFRQYSIGHYIVDFYCPSVRLAIEIDGSQHAENRHMGYDERRTQFLQQRGICVLRFWNNWINENIEGVLITIVNKLK